MDFSKHNNVVAKFEGDAKFLFRIEKADVSYNKEDEGKMILMGVASSANIDHDQERMALPALQRMASIINEKSVPLRIEHQKSDEAIVGKVIAGSVDERGNLNIKAELDPGDPRSKQIYDAMKSGTKLGYSVGGRVKSAVREMAEGMGKKIKTFYDVILDEVSLTPRPANFDAYAIAKSIANNNEEADTFRFTPVYNNFLFENPQLDYLAVIEKSIPDSKWVKVDQSKEDIMKKLFSKDGSSSSSSSSDEAEKDVTDAAGYSMKETSEIQQPEEGTTATKSYVDKKFATLVDLLKGIRKDIASTNPNADAQDSESPKREKAETLASDVESDQVARQQGKVTTGLSDTADDQHNPTETKAVDEESTTKSSSNTHKTAVSLLNLAKRLLKEEREGQEDTIGNGDNGMNRQHGEATDTVDTTAFDQENPTATKSRKVRKTSLDVETGTVEPQESTDQNNPMEPKKVSTATMESETTKNRKLAYEMLKTAKQLLSKDTFVPPVVTSENGTTTNTTTNLEDFETAKELIMTETTKPETTTDVSTNLDQFETAKGSSSSSSDHFNMEADEDELISTHDMHGTSEKTNSYGDQYKVSDKSRMSAPIDLLVAHISKTLDELKATASQDHHRILGLETQFVDGIQKNEELQKSIKELMAIPGPKKSVSMGVAYMFTKDGKRYPLNRLGEEEVNKSTSKEGETFKEFWKREKSTTLDGQ